MNVSFRQIKAFLQVARLGNFTRAAEKMHVTQAGLSIMMRELEAQLNCRLFDRTTRIVTLTAAGEQFLPVAARMVAELEASAEQLGEMTNKARHVLHVGVTPLVSSNVLPQAWQLFRAKHPEVKVKVVDTDPQQVQALVDGGELDFGLGAFFTPTAGIELVPLFEYQLMWIQGGVESGQETGRKTRRKDVGDMRQMPASTVSWSALMETPLISLPLENKIQQWIEGHLSGIGRGHEDRPTFNNFETLIAMVSAGMGTAIVPSYAIAACRRHGVQAAMLADPTARLNFYRITKRGRAIASTMDDFTAAFIAAVPSEANPRT
ncbi:LysR family transcriptional regulator [Eoetvoesiella caeni]